MKEKNSFQITLAGKSYTLAGNESNEYLKRIADHIEKKYTDYSANISYRTQPMDMQHVMLEVNIATHHPSHLCLRGQGNLRTISLQPRFC